VERKVIAVGSKVIGRIGSLKDIIKTSDKRENVNPRRTGDEESGVCEVTFIAVIEEIGTTLLGRNAISVPKVLAKLRYVVELERAKSKAFNDLTSELERSMMISRPFGPLESPELKSNEMQSATDRFAQDCKVKIFRCKEADNMGSLKTRFIVKA
jgi:hypothetical protein